MTQPLLGEGEDVTAMFSVPSAKDGDDVTAMFSVPSVNEGKDANAMFSVPSAEDGEDVTSQFNASAKPAEPTSNVLANMGRSVLGGVASGVADIAGGAAGLLAMPGRSDAEDIAEFETKSAAISAKPSVFKDFTEEQITGMQAAPEGYRTPQEEVQLASYDSTLKTLRERQVKNAPIQQGLEDFQKLSSEASKEAQTFFGQDPARQDEFLSKLATGVGSLPPYIASSIAGGPVASMMIGALQTGQNEYNAAIEAGKPELADEAMVKGMGIGLTEGAGVGGGLGKAAKGFAAKALVTLKKAFEEGGQEWVQNTLSNLNASTFTGYEPERPAFKGSGEAFAIGAILGGGVEGVGQSIRKDPVLSAVAPSTAAAVARTQPVTVTVPEVATPTMPSGSLGPPDPIVVEAEAAGALQTAAALNQTMPPKPFAPRIEEPGTPTPYGRETDVYDITTGLQRKPAPAPPAAKAGEGGFKLIRENSRWKDEVIVTPSAKGSGGWQVTYIQDAYGKGADSPSRDVHFDSFDKARRFANGEKVDGQQWDMEGFKPAKPTPTAPAAPVPEPVVESVSSADMLKQRETRAESIRDFLKTASKEDAKLAEKELEMEEANISLLRDELAKQPDLAAPAFAAQAPAPVAKAMTRSEINERIAVLLKAPAKAGGKPRVSFKTQAEEASFRRGFEAANKKPGEPLPEQLPGVPAKEQKIYDAFSQGWSQAQIAIRSLNQPTPSATGATAQKMPWEMTRFDYAESAKPNKIPADFDALDALAKRNNRSPYNPDVITDAAMQEFKKLGWISGTKNFKLTEAGRNKLDDWRRDARENDLAAGDASDNHIELVEKALREGKPVPESVLADYPDLKPTPTAPAAPKTAPVAAAPVAKEIAEAGDDVTWMSGGRKAQGTVIRVVGDKAGIDYFGYKLVPISELTISQKSKQRLRRESKKPETPKTEEKQEVIDDILSEPEMAALRNGKAPETWKDVSGSTGKLAYQDTSGQVWNINTDYASKTITLNRQGQSRSYEVKVTQASPQTTTPAKVAPPAAPEPAPVAAAQPEKSGKAKTDKIEAALDKAIDALKPSKGTFYVDPLFIQTVGRPALRAALMVARAAYRAGKTIAEAVADGIAHLKTLVKNLDEAKAREFFAAAGLDDGLPMPGDLVEGGREGEYYTRVAERDKGTLSDNAWNVVRNRTTLPDSFKEDVDFAAEMLADDGDLAKSLRRTKSMAGGITEFFSNLTDRRKAALLFLIAQNAATQRETATDPKQIAALKDVEAEAIADFSDLMSQGGKLLNIAGQLYAAMPMSPDAQVMAAEKLLARMTGGRAAEVEAAQAKDTLKTALDEQLKGMNESIRDIMRTKPKSSWDEIRQRIADEVVAKMNLATEAERKAATDKIIADLKKRMEKVRKELLAKMSKPGKPGNKTALDKLWKLWELGALDDDALTKVFMEKAGVQEFTPAFRDKLKKMYEDAEKAPEGMPRDRILSNIAVEIALANPKTFGFWWNLAMSISYGNILGAFTTIFVNNPLGSLATSLEMVAMGSLSNKGARAETFKGAVKTWARSFGDGVAMMRDLWSTGENLQKISQFDSALVNSPVELLAKMAEDPSYPKAFRAAAKEVSQYKWIMRSMMAADAVIRWPAREALRFTQSAAIAKDTRRPGQSLEDAVDELNYPGGRPAAVREARAQAAKERKDGTLKTKLDERLRVIQLLQFKLSSEGTEAATESEELANYGSLLNDQPQDFIGVIASTILKIAFPSNTKSDLQKALGGAAQPFVRFVRTSANATRVMLDYSIGYGAFRYMTRNWPIIGAESLAGGVNLVEGRAGDRITQVRIQRAYLGIALYAGLAAIYAAIDDDDEDPYIDFIGSGPTTPDERRRVRESGVRLNSIKIGDNYFPTNVGMLQPLAGNFAPFQRMRDNKKYPKGTSDIVGEKVPETAGVAVAKGIADAMMNQLFTRSLAEFLTMLNTGKTSFGETPQEFFGKNLAQFIPGNLRGLSQLDEIVNGKKERADGFFDTAANSIAFYAPNGRATTILGDEVDAGKSLAQKAGEKVFQFTTLADDKTLQFVVKNGLSIPDRRPRPSDGKRQTYLEYSAYMRESGKMMRNWLETKNSETGKTGMEMLQSIPEEVPGEKGKPINLRKKEMNKLWSEFRQVALLKQ